MPEHSPELTSSLWNYDVDFGLDAKLGDPRRPAVGVHGAGRLRGLDADPHLLGRLHEVRRGLRARYFAYLNFFVFSMLLLVLAGNFLLLIVGWAFVGAASYLLISFWYRRNTATNAGIKAFVINVLGDVGLVLGTFFIFRHTGTLSTSSGRSPPRPHVFHHNSDRPRRGLPAAARRRVRQVRPGPAAHLAPGRDGGPDPGLRADPRRDDGDRRRVPDRAHAPAVRDRARPPPTSARSSAARRCDRRDDRDRADRPQARDRLLDDVPDRLHDHGRLRRRLLAPACFT